MLDGIAEMVRFAAGDVAMRFRHDYEEGKHFVREFNIFRPGRETWRLHLLNATLLRAIQRFVSPPPRDRVRVNGEMESSLRKRKSR